MTEPIALFGGTFDPVHFGHLRAALEARQQLGVDCLRLLPAGTPPHRNSTRAEKKHRLAMLERAIDGFQGFAVDDREIRRPGNSFMVDTLESFRLAGHQGPLILLLGLDAAMGIESWHRWQSLLRLSHLVILSRPGSKWSELQTLPDCLQQSLTHDTDVLMQCPAGKVTRLNVTQLEISSTHIRKELKEGRSVRYLLPESVRAYIHEHGLYGC